MGPAAPEWAGIGTEIVIGKGEICCESGAFGAEKLRGVFEADVSACDLQACAFGDGIEGKED